MEISTLGIATPSSPASCQAALVDGVSSSACKTAVQYLHIDIAIQHPMGSLVKTAAIATRWSGSSHCHSIADLNASRGSEHPPAVRQESGALETAGHRFAVPGSQQYAAARANVRG